MGRAESFTNDVQADFPDAQEIDPINTTARKIPLIARIAAQRLRSAAATRPRYRRSLRYFECRVAVGCSG
jgi:hypothetical protein